MLCSICRIERNTKTSRLPRGWKRQGKKPCCDKCWRERYILRAITFPVVGPVGGKWHELRESLSIAWSQSTALSNWLLTEMYSRDVRREPGMEKLPPMRDIYLYPEARQRFSELPPAAVTSIIHSVRGRYRAARFKLIWTTQESLANYRYPTPYPVPASAWKPLFGANNVPMVNVRIGRDRWTLQLRGGPHFRRQLCAFRKLVAGAAVTTELALYRQRASRGDHRAYVEDRAAGGAQRVQYRTMCKIVAWLPRQEQSNEKKGVLIVRTANDCFWRAVVEGRDDTWVLNADHVHRWQHAHQRKRSRLTHDIASTHNQRAIGEHRLKVAEKHRRRMQSFCHEATAQLAKYAERQRVAHVSYDDSEKSYFSEFPWHLVRTLLQDKLDERGIELVDAASAPASPESLKAA